MTDIILVLMFFGYWMAFVLMGFMLIAHAYVLDSDDSDDSDKKSQKGN